jgi:dienelactone hydrolase
MASANGSSKEQAVHVEVGDVVLEGDLTLPQDTSGVVLFAHGSGSSRHSPRNRAVARRLQSSAFGTLLLDLLTADEDAIDAETAELRFNISLLATRLQGAIDWLARNRDTSTYTVGVFGASTGAAAAIMAASERPERVTAVVSRGGRPDLAGAALERVQRPTLLIVGGADAPVIDLNRQALARLRCREKELVIVPGAGHLFEQPGALEQVAQLAATWFTTHTPQTEGIAR